MLGVYIRTFKFVFLSCLLVTLSSCNTDAHSKGDLDPQVENWIFDQAPSVAAVTTRQVVREGFPVLVVSHYEEDHSWGFFCGTTDKSEDLMLVSMSEVLNVNPDLENIADLPPGWSAERSAKDKEWRIYKDEE